MTPHRGAHMTLHERRILARMIGHVRLRDDPRTYGRVRNVESTPDGVFLSVVMSDGRWVSAPLDQWERWEAMQ